MVPHDPPTGEVGFVVSGKGVDFPMSTDLPAVIPAHPGDTWFAAVRAAAGTQRRCRSRSATSAESTQAVSFGVYHVGDEDAFYVRWNGGGGVRDPLARDPCAVVRDIAEGVVSRDAARELYGVVVAPDGSLDVDATKQRRIAMRGEEAARTSRRSLRRQALVTQCARTGSVPETTNRRSSASAFVNG